MTDQDIIQFAVIGVFGLAAGAVAYVLAAPFLFDERRVAKRVRNVATNNDAMGQGDQGVDSANRRKLVQETLEDIEAKRKNLKRRVTIKESIAHAGYKFKVRSFYIASALMGLAAAAITLNIGGGMLLAVGTAFAAGAGLPRWILNFLRSRRQKKFLEEFPNAIDVVVRGVKAGLPLNDTLRTIAAESAEPVRSEFREVVEGQVFGVPIDESIERMYERVPLAEVNFFAIVIHIQLKSGGNLAEALSNLSKVLRDRKLLRGKIQAMSQEAKWSAGIIGALPIAVMLLVYVTTPGYIALLWETQLGRIMLAGSVFWMSCGVLVMRKMINFDF